MSILIQIVVSQTKQNTLEKENCKTHLITSDPHFDHIVGGLQLCFSPLLHTSVSDLILFDGSNLLKTKL